MPDLPPMPRPEDFGISDRDWSSYQMGNEWRLFYDRGGYAKVQAYLGALEIWKEVAKSVASRADTVNQLEIRQS